MYAGSHHKLKDTFIVFWGRGGYFRKFVLQIMSLIETTTKPSKGLLLSSQHLMTLNLLVEKMKPSHSILYETQAPVKMSFILYVTAFSTISHIYNT